MKPELTQDESKLTQLEAEALEWLVQRRDGELSANDERAYRVWLERAPSHRQTADRMERYWKLMGDLGEDPEIIALTERRMTELNRPLRFRRYSALAASITLALGLGWGLRGSEFGAYLIGLVVNEPQEVAYEQSFRTSVGQRTEVTLADGTTVTLDTDSVLHTHLTSEHRNILLERGRAYFDVYTDHSRPFVVSAADKTVVATGTAFSVDVASSQGVTVTLVEGQVRVEAPDSQSGRKKAYMLKPGWQLIATNEMHAKAVNVQRATSWTSGRLHFMNDTLGTAVDAMNRYSDKKIVIDDESLKAHPIIGNFRAGDIDAFVRAIRLYGFASVSVETDDVVHLVPTATH